jgi:hypothetical protein
VAWYDELYRIEEMKTLLLSLTYAVGIGELILAGYFWVTNSKNEIRRVMALLAMVTGLWCIGSAFVAYATVTSSVMFFLKLVYIFGMLITTSLLHFVILFPFPLFTIDRYHKILAYIPITVFSGIILFSNLVVSSYLSSYSIAGDTIGGPLFTLYNYLLTALFVVVVALLIYRFRSTDGSSKKNVLIILISVLLGGLPAVLNDLIFYSVDISLRINTLVVNLTTVAWLISTTYIVRKK